MGTQGSPSAPAATLPCPAWDPAPGTTSCSIPCPRRDPSQLGQPSRRSLRVNFCREGDARGGWRGLVSPRCQLPAPAHKPRLCRELAAACQREPALLPPPAREQMRSDRSSDMEVRSCA